MRRQVAINGFGRIGRAFTRIAESKQDSEIEIAAINDLTDPQILAHLLRRDTVHGAFPGEVRATDNSIIINGREIPCSSERDPSNLNWGEKEISTVIESTGHFRDREGASKHLEAGAEEVLISAPAKNPDGTFVIGVNDHEYNPDRDKIISIASCTTNCAAQIAKILDDTFGIIRGSLTTTHSYTGDQSLVDGPHQDPRRTRAAAANIIPTSTGASQSIGKVLPNLEGKLRGVAIRVPVPNGSLVEFNATLEQGTSIDEINRIFRTDAQKLLNGIIEFSEEPLVSSDIIGNPHSAIIDSLLTDVRDGIFVTVYAWYDNEWGYANRLYEFAEEVAKQKQ